MTVTMCRNGETRGNVRNTCIITHRSPIFQSRCCKSVGTFLFLATWCPVVSVKTILRSARSGQSKISTISVLRRPKLQQSIPLTMLMLHDSIGWGLIRVHFYLCTLLACCRTQKIERVALGRNGRTLYIWFVLTGIKACPPPHKAIYPCAYRHTHRGFRFTYSRKEKHVPYQSIERAGRRTARKIRRVTDLL